MISYVERATRSLNWQDDMRRSRSLLSLFLKGGVSVRCVAAGRP